MHPRGPAFFSQEEKKERKGGVGGVLDFSCSQCVPIMS